MKIKLLHMLSLLLIAQILISMFVLSFDLGATHLGIYLSTTINNVVPSILPTAAITQTPESSALVLAFSWVMSLVFAAAMMFKLDWNGAKSVANSKLVWRGAEPPTWIAFLSLFLLLTALIILPLKGCTPTEFTQRGRSTSIRPSLDYLFLKDFKLFIIFYGAAISLLFSGGFFLLAFMSATFYFRIAEKNKTQ